MKTLLNTSLSSWSKLHLLQICRWWVSVLPQSFCQCPDKTFPSFLQWRPIISIYSWKVKEICCTPRSSPCPLMPWNPNHYWSYCLRNLAIKSREWKRIFLFHQKQGVRYFLCLRNKGSEFLSVYDIRGLKICKGRANNFRGVKNEEKKFRGPNFFLEKNKGSEKNCHLGKKCSERVPGRKITPPL